MTIESNIVQLVAPYQETVHSHQIMNIVQTIGGLTLNADSRLSLCALNAITTNFLEQIPESYDPPNHIKLILNRIIQADRLQDNIVQWKNIYNDVKQTIHVTNITMSHNEQNSQRIEELCILQSSLFLSKIKILNIEESRRTTQQQ